MKCDGLRTVDTKKMELNEVISMLNPFTMMGIEEKSKMSFYTDIEELKNCFLELEEAKFNYQSHKEEVNKVENLLAHIKDLRYSLGCTISGQVLNSIELFEVKQCGLRMQQIKKYLDLIRHDNFSLEMNDVGELIKILDPKNEGLETFYIYDDFSLKLSEIRKRKRECGKILKLEIENLKKQVQIAFDVKVSQEHFVRVSKDQKERIEKMNQSHLLKYDSETYMQIQYKIRYNDKTIKYLELLDGLKENEEEEIFQVQKKLSQGIAKIAPKILENYERIAKLDFLWAKVRLAIKMDGKRPEISSKNYISIKNGFHPIVAKNLKETNILFQPLSITCESGVTCITGANMGGKTVCLKTTALLVSMMHLGLMVPCEKMACGLFEKLWLITGDEQSTKKGLSTFGSEISEVKEAIKTADKNTLILVDELASGTNPEEGQALLMALKDYLKRCPAISILTTHYDGIANDSMIKHYQVRGLENTSIEEVANLNDENERLVWLKKHMDYSLKEVDTFADVPKDALRIARMMGLEESVVKAAETILEKK
jgi:dsDNA-specific endonuclease/ATPase MutS2